MSSGKALWEQLNRSYCRPDARWQTGEHRLGKIRLILSKYLAVLIHDYIDDPIT